MAAHSEITGYSRLQIVLHWLVVALVALEYATGELIDDGGGGLAFLHIWPGIAIIAAIALRLLIRMIRGAPPPPASEHPLLRRAAVWTHRAFYVLLIAVPAGGLLDRYYGIEGSFLLHDIGEGIFFVLMWLHIAAALVHHFVLRTDVLRRMLKPAR